MALTVQNGALRLEGTSLGTGQDCCCGGGGGGGGAQCCCVGTSAISLDENLDPTGEPCQDIEQLDSGESCDGEQVSKPNPAQSCEDVSVVVEWCGLTVNLEFPFDTSEDSVQAPNFPFPPPLCTGDGVDVYRKSMWVGYPDSLGNPEVENFSECQFGCVVRCNRLLIRLGVLVDETPGIGAARSRLYYVTLREGCDGDQILETVYTQGGYCCPEDPEITITIAP